MKIALVHHPLGHRAFSENLKVVDEEFCLAPPIILAYVAAILEKSGHEVKLIDANVLHYDKEKTLKVLKGFNPEFIGFRADSYWFDRVVEWATFFKERLNVRIIVGGININLYPKESFLYNCFDFGILGEANESLPELLFSIKNKLSFDNIKGLIYREKDKIIINDLPKEMVSFDKYPYPARHLLPNEQYYSFTSQLKNFTIMVTSTGCPYKCKFCAISKIPYRERSAFNVIKEIEECFYKYKIREIDFFDACFFINRGRVMEICDEIIKRQIKIEWSCRSRVDIIDDELLRKAYEAGCRKIYYGIESESDGILKNINKNIDKKKVIEAIRLTKKNKIMTLGFFMVGNPGDTKESILSSINFAKKLDLDFVQVCRTIAKPNTDLNNMLIKKNNFDFWSEYISGKKQEIVLERPWSNLSDKEIEKYIKKFYKDFYFRPAYIAKHIIKIKSLSEFIRYLKAAVKWFLMRNKFFL